MLQFGQFVLTRAFLAIVTLLTVSFIVFTLMEMVPANCAERYLSYKSFQGGQISQEDIAAEERRLGLDKPYVIRWAGWVGNVFFRGDFGNSCILRVSINQLLGHKFWISLGICLASLMLAYIIAIPANEIVVPTILMAYTQADKMFELDSLAELQTLLVGQEGWTLLTAACLMLFSLLHNPCSTTIWTIYKETKSIKWSVVSGLMPLGIAFVLLFIIAQIARALGAS